MAAVPHDREAADDDDRFGVCWGLRSPTAAIQTMSLNFGGQYFYLEKGKWNSSGAPPSRRSPRTSTP